MDKFWFAIDANRPVEDDVGAGAEAGVGDGRLAADCGGGAAGLAFFACAKNELVGLPVSKTKGSLARSGAKPEIPRPEVANERLAVEEPETAAGNAGTGGTGTLVEKSVWVPCASSSSTESFAGTRVEGPEEVMSSM